MSSTAQRRLSGPKKLCLLRIGDAPPRDVADEAKRVMITIWNKAMGKPVTEHEGRCLWGMTGDMMKLLAAVGLPAELGGELAIAVFKFALADWQQVASALKLAMQSQPDCTPRFYEYPSITVIRRFWKAAVYAYVQAIFKRRRRRSRPDWKCSPIARGQASSTILVEVSHTDPIAGTASLTAEADSANGGGTRRPTPSSSPRWRMRHRCERTVLVHCWY